MRHPTLLLVASIVLLGACADTAPDLSAPPRATGPIQFNVSALAAGAARCGYEIPVIATVTDTRGRPVVGLLVNFNATEGGGQMFAGSAITNRDGVARDYWTLGPSRGTRNSMAIRAVDQTTGAKSTYFTQTVRTVGRIAYFAAPGELWLMDEDGANPQRIAAPGNFSVSSPSWSPDGLQFLVAVNGKVTIYNQDGALSSVVTGNSIDDIPDWSPDGTRIAFKRSIYNPSPTPNSFSLWVMNADGSAPTLVKDFGNREFTRIEWSPDGSRILSDPARKIVVVNSDGSNEQNLTPDAENYYAPAWSPNGTRIAFSKLVQGQFTTFPLFVMNADGTNQQQLTNGSSASQPSWSPDGTKIAFSTYFSSNSDIGAINADGTGLVQLTTGTAGKSAPSWSGCAR